MGDDDPVLVGEPEWEPLRLAGHQRAVVGEPDQRELRSTRGARRARGRALLPDEHAASATVLAAPASGAE